MKKVRLRSLAVLTLTIVLLYLVLRSVSISDLINTLRGANPWFVLLSFAVTPVMILSSVIKWRELLKAQGQKVPLWYLYRLYIVGYFFNNFLPSNVGGDVVRTYELGSRTKDLAGAAATVFAERFTGFVVLIVVACVAFVTNMTLADDPRLVMLMVLAVGGLLGVLWLIMDRRPVDLLMRYIKLPLAQKVFIKFRKFHASLQILQAHRRTLIVSLFWSLVFYGCAILNVYVSALAFHHPVPLGGVAIIVPIIMLISLLPLTFNGIGLQEWAYVLLFGWIGLAASVGLSTIVLIRAKILVLSLIGGVIYPSIRIGGAVSKDALADIQPFNIE